MSENDYELEYDFADTKTNGKVIVTILGNTETHKLLVGTRRIGEYSRNINLKEDKGTTYFFGTKRRIKLGSGNLLAGALFRLHQMRVRKVQTSKQK